MFLIVTADGRCVARGLFTHLHLMETRDLSPLERKLTHSIIGSALTVHREFGPGLLESAYEECLAYELGERGLSFERQAERPIVFKASNSRLHIAQISSLNGRLLSS